MHTHRGYISRWQRRERPNNYTMDYWFTSNPESAARWETKEEADIDCAMLDRHRIVIPSLGGEYVLQGFKAEERKSGGVVVFCEGPFIPKQASSETISTS
jgi:hypothetical protein